MIKISLTILWKEGRTSTDSETIKSGLGLSLGGPKSPAEQTVPCMQDARMGSETVIESGYKADGLHAKIASRGAHGLPRHILFSTNLPLL